MNNFKKRMLPMTLSVCIVLSGMVFVPTDTSHVEAKAKTVYVASSGNGSCYHKTKTCRTIKNTKVKSMKLKKAKKAGYRSCKVCK